MGLSFWLGALLCWGIFHLLEGNEEARLFDALFADYDKTVRPVGEGGGAVEVQVKLTLTNLISLHEKDETLTTNVWITQQWLDYRLNYSSKDFGGISLFRVSADMVWLPDVVLENNIDGKFEVAYFANVLISPGGVIAWIPPAIFSSSCSIEVTFFPFDWQNCSLVFRSQTYNAKEVELKYGRDDVTGEILKKIVIDPAAFTAGGQKCIASISVLLAQTVFLFLIAKKVPETSLGIPLIGKYLLFVMVVATLIVMNCVIVLNVSLRSPNTHSMSEQLKHVRRGTQQGGVCHLLKEAEEVFLEVLPRYLGSSLEPAGDDPWDAPRPRRRSSFGVMLKAEEYILKKPWSEILFEHQGLRHGLQRVPGYSAAYGLDVGMTSSLYKNLASLAPEIKECVDACNFIAESSKTHSADSAEMENWVLIGQVIDKLCFWIAILLFTIGTLAIFFMGYFNAVPDNPFPGEEEL
ncbi:acetylcholine receptor subunit epsilon isoform X3 [Rhineura floridana]|uniref:acetylcholine receptor subunit epsilon isoform X3 n=1 Tax=Rhineura floridana TaxID=261503 RepID=UPI002AC87DFF|nr:acetylcholine receptor subunit epsilon isoform X3 [Rhineura floridana]